MGCASTTEQNLTLNVATLNYSGILLSPYEFYASDEENKIISKFSDTFSRLASKHYPNFSEKNSFKWELGKIDQLWQRQRYTPIYNPACGIKNNVYLVDEEEFIEKWNAQFQKNKQIKGKLQQLEESVWKKQVQNCRTFDLLCYKTLLHEIYGLEQFDKVNVKAKKYKLHQRNIFSKNFLNQTEKSKLILQALQKMKIDIFFLQECTNELVEQIQKHTNQFRITKPNVKIQAQDDCKSVILIRQTKFPGLRSLKEENNIFYRNTRQLRDKDTQEQTILAEELKQLNFNGDTVVQVVGNLILICPHLSSKEEKNRVQIAQLKTSLFKLKYWFPNYNIISAGDLNGRFEMGDFQKQIGDQIKINGKTKNIWENEEIRSVFQNTHFNLFPAFHDNITSKKKRTMMQAQRKKANEYVKGVKDYIFSDLPLFDQRVQTIRGVKITQDDDNVPYLPNTDHPYDHFLVSARVQLTRPIQHSHEVKYLLKFNPNKLTKQQIQELETE